MPKGPPGPPVKSTAAGCLPMRYPDQVCAPSSTPLWVASVTSNAGTMVPAAEVLICSLPAVVLFTRSANWLKLSMNVLDAGQLACIVSVRGAPACCACAATAPHKIAPATATRIDVDMVLLLSGHHILVPHGRGTQARGTQEAHDQRDPRLEEDRREDGLHVGARLHVREMGGERRGGRMRGRRQPRHDLPRPPEHHSGDDGHDVAARC